MKFLPWNRKPVEVGSIWIDKNTGRYWKVQNSDQRILLKCLYDMRVLEISRFKLWLGYVKSLKHNV